MTLHDLTRMKDRRDGDRAVLDRLLDEALVATLATVSEDGRPWAVPMLVARSGDRVLLHGSTGAGALRRVAAGTEAVVEVHVVDGLVLATSMFEHTANYRSAVVRGRLRALTGDEAVAALDGLSDALVPGRRAEVRGMMTKEVRATVVLALDLTEDNWILKVRDGDTDEDPDEVPDDVWTGVVPLHTVAGDPRRSPWLPELPVPPSVDGLRQRFAPPPQD
ncbi:pyridoxamine 5'-phosphate oxidase family protein [Nocardioides coralli]|uniref:pyridoxamine 5'-phosphate oxidase family protein n=1 Tax=Nocardioides coralli TaxID=2872154 RepID=UPI001CA440BA|nr:pyridoxamine 5'-phosphate oxidase family protein [Nocardioides coralli]QZY29015.1 pyridoxamine 5'-phosphate oxidase family protein [Nocardioides coralli]